MEGVLEIRDGCNTPEQLLRSLAFARYLKIYKEEFVTDLTSREKNRGEAQHKAEMIRKITLRDITKILDANHFSPDELERARSVVKFLDGGFHHFRNKSYSRLVRLQNEVVSSGTESQGTIKDKVTEKAAELNDLILETRRRLLSQVGLGYGVRRTPGMDASPNVTAGEISGHYCNIPAAYSILCHVPLTMAADIRTGVDYRTPANRRAYPFFQLDHNPLHLENFDPEEWVSVPLRVGRWLIIAYIHKSRGCIEMEPGLLNLFPFADVEQTFPATRPDGLYFFGDPNGVFGEDLGYYWDEDNQLLIGLVPQHDEYKYFGYCKKPILTLHNVLSIRCGDVPLHCGCTRYLVGFEGDEPYISEMLIKADDMGRVVLERANGASFRRPIFYGTEIGAFACLDGFSEQAKLAMEGREVGYNNHMGSNARQVVPVAEESEVALGSNLDVLLYLNNFDIKEEGESCIDTEIPVPEALEHFRKGERVAAGSTQTHRGKKESSYWANPFPALMSNDGDVLHPDLYEQFSETEASFMKDVEALVEREEMYLGVAYSQLMAGVYEGVEDDDVTRCGFANREEIEQVAPERLALELIQMVKQIAVKKRERLGGDAKEVDVTVALVGDSRTGKSETGEKLEAVLGLTLV